MRFFHQRRRAWHLMQDFIDHHVDTLALRHRKAFTPDRYGAAHPEQWGREKTYFFTAQLIPALQAARLVRFWPGLKKRVEKLIEKRLRQLARQEIVPVSSAVPPEAADRSSQGMTASMDPLEYERYCAQLLSQAGWKARLTPASSDQGADVIATRNGQKLVVQCKLYSRPVGNRAVQEVFAARQYQQGHIAAVVTNAGYTRQARELAASTGVLLLHHRQLGALEKYLSPTPPL